MSISTPCLTGERANVIRLWWYQRSGSCWSCTWFRHEEAWEKRWNWAASDRWSFDNESDVTTTETHVITAHGAFSWRYLNPYGKIEIQNYFVQYFSRPCWPRGQRRQRYSSWCSFIMARRQVKHTMPVVVSRFTSIKSDLYNAGDIVCERLPPEEQW